MGATGAAAAEWEEGPEGPAWGAEGGAKALLSDEPTDVGSSAAGRVRTDAKKGKEWAGSLAEKEGGTRPEDEEEGTPDEGPGQPGPTRGAGASRAGVVLS